MSVQRYRKKPVVIDAMQYDGRNTVEVAEWLASSGVKVGWSNAEMVIPTLEGRMHATPGDWIIRGVQGEFYPIKDSIFREIYEASEQADREPSDAEVEAAGEAIWGRGWRVPKEVVRAALLAAREVRDDA